MFSGRTRDTESIENGLQGFKRSWVQTFCNCARVGDHKQTTFLDKLSSRRSLAKVVVKIVDHDQRSNYWFRIKRLIKHMGSSVRSSTDSCTFPSVVLPGSARAFPLAMQTRMRACFCFALRIIVMLVRSRSADVLLSRQ